MPTCLKHMQSYSQGEYCVYCGQPTQFVYTSTLNIPISYKHEHEFGELITTSAGNIRACKTCGFKEIIYPISPTITSGDKK